MFIAQEISRNVLEALLCCENYAKTARQSLHQNGPKCGWQCDTKENPDGLIKETEKGDPMVSKASG